ncbi:hypothetical protein RD1_3692 [Roseobacter denitrificans OCh 114]|uniref:Uncharacterized protein n=1 Tax=Roseobacter denitrificans (strain ATCC 33942 / OCh 114) TaxID=375451 RepID=Q162C9_ROSDO|nr:hypothetical protein RD1_3692 [Roseobacter denitrificans OCh 114]
MGCLSFDALHTHCKEAGRQNRQGKDHRTTVPPKQADCAPKGMSPCFG